MTKKMRKYRDFLLKQLLIDGLLCIMSHKGDIQAQIRMRGEVKVAFMVSECKGEPQRVYAVSTDFSKPGPIDYGSADIFQRWTGYAYYIDCRNTDSPPTMNFVAEKVAELLIKDLFPEENTDIAVPKDKAQLTLAVIEGIKYLASSQ
jgi:hypothetical protein